VYQRLNRETFVWHGHMWDIFADGCVRYLYEKVWALDACMKMKVKEASKAKRSEDDPYPSSGCGAFTHEQSFRSHLMKWGHLPQVNTFYLSMPRHC
jgi:hypothetical protein